jgi:mannan endo-1,4-beta-mannosidase
MAILRSEGPARRGAWGLPRGAWLALALALAPLWLKIAASPASAASVIHPSRTIYWGAQIGAQYTGEAAPWDMNAVTAFDKKVGKQPSLVAFNIPWQLCASGSCTPYYFPTTQMQQLRSYGVLPMLNWSSGLSPLALDQPAFRLKSIYSGAYDSYLRTFATEVKDWGHPFFLRFDWEMNGDWFPWGQASNGNRPRDFVRAWRHVHDIFTRVGATNATWVWCPYVTQSPTESKYDQLYPGNAYVDWTCLDGFNFGDRMNGPNGWHSFDSLYYASYREITKVIAPTKPMLIGEIASSEYGGSKPQWIRNMLGQLPVREPKIRGLVWFDSVDPRLTYKRLGDNIASSRSSLKAFSTAIDNPSYLGNSFHDFMSDPIPTPRTSWSSNPLGP